MLLTQMLECPIQLRKYFVNALDKTSLYNYHNRFGKGKPCNQQDLVYLKLIQECSKKELQSWRR